MRNRMNHHLLPDLVITRPLITPVSILRRTLATSTTDYADYTDYTNYTDYSDFADDVPMHLILRL